MVTKKSFSLPELLKWAVIALMIYSIWKCIKADSESFKNEANTKDTFDSGPVPMGATHNVDQAEPICGGATAGQGVGSCGGEGGCDSSTGSKLLPVLDPCFNMREICKQCILLEDHLFQTEKRCTDCIKKHFLTIEGLAEEAITLDKKNEYHLSKEKLPEKVRGLQRKFIEGNTPESIAQELRWIRKPLMAKFFHKF